MMNRRKFLHMLGIGVSLSKSASALGIPSAGMANAIRRQRTKVYGSGYFGEWITDEFGLPAYRYTCNQMTDPKAISPVHTEWRSATDHTHQVGNDRLVAAVSNYGYVQVRQDEGSPKFLNDYLPEHGRYGAGIGFLTDGKQVLSTYYHSGNCTSFDRILGEGYLKKTVNGHGYAVEHTILAPFGDDPVLISMVKITNHSGNTANLRWVEYWGCLNYQFSHRSMMEANELHATRKGAALRRAFAQRFEHKFEIMPNGTGLMETQKFLTRTVEDKKLWAKIEGMINDPEGPWGGHPYTPAADSSMEDLNPPPTFLVSLDAPMDGYATDGTGFFGSGGVEHPSGLANELTNDLSATDASSALLLERHLVLKPHESQTIYFLYGYVPEGFEAESLVKKYSADPAGVLARSSASWKKEGLRFRVPSEPWVEREMQWSNYYLRSNITFDKFFGEPIISQGHVYQYIFGFQGAARDPLQHTMPYIFSDPEIVKGIIRYTLKEIQPDGSIPYAIVGNGVPMPTVYNPSDQEMWLLWTTSEYVLATRDKEFLNERVPAYPHRDSRPSDPTVGEALFRAYSHLVNVIGVGKHGLMRLAKGDWNDGIVVGRVPSKYMEEVAVQGESVLNAAMACYVLDLYARMLSYIGDTENAALSHGKAEGMRRALHAIWGGHWFPRAWLGPNLGWIGGDRIWLEPQPWAILGGATNPEQTKILINSIDHLLRDPSPIGAMILNKGERIPGKGPGILENGGIWPSINGTLIWALAMAGSRSAWDEWKKNCLSAHAEAYPEIWYGIWSGPDTYNSIQARYPGQTMFGEKRADSSKGSETDPGVYWTDFPVMNMHPHSWPLYSAAKLLGMDFREEGVKFAPVIPVAEYEFESSLVGFKKARQRYTGWYAPAATGQWRIEIQLPQWETACLKCIKVNGVTKALRQNAKTIQFSGEGGREKPLRWEIL